MGFVSISRQSSPFCFKVIYEHVFLRVLKLAQDAKHEMLHAQVAVFEHRTPHLGHQHSVPLTVIFDVFLFRFVRKVLRGRTFARYYSCSRVTPKTSI